MLRGLKLTNFKAIQTFELIRPSVEKYNDEQQIGGNKDDFLQFKNLTIFAGANSSGKSSIIQSLLLIAQTLENNYTTGLKLNGELISLGEVGDVWNSESYESQDKGYLTYILKIDDVDDLTLQHAYYLNFYAVDEKQISLYSGYYLTEKTDGTYRNIVSIYSTADNGYVIDEMTPDWTEVFRNELDQSGFDNIEIGQTTRLSMRNFFPQQIEFKAIRTKRTLDWNSVLLNPLNAELKQYSEYTFPDEQWGVLIEAVKKLRLKEIPTSKSKSPDKTISHYERWFGKLTSNDSNRLKEYLTSNLQGLKEEIIESYAPSFMRQINRSLLETFTKNLRYLSANRQAPTMLFNSNKMFLWAEVGVNGENVATAIRDYGNHLVALYDDATNTIQEQPMLTFLIGWMKTFNLLDSLEIIDRGKIGITLQIVDKNVQRTLDLTSIGFGTSQVLPIIVQGLLTPINGTFIVEQPEVHLHPTAQAKLADFFLMLARSDIQCIIETHSEHIINRLRLRIAQDDTTQTMNHIQIYFAEKENGRSRFVEVVPNEYGAIPDWPDGFFDQVDIDLNEISILGAKKRQLKRKAKN